MDVFYYNGNRITCLQGATERDYQLIRCKYEFVALNRLELIRELEKPKRQKVRYLTESEIEVQNKWALSMMTDEERSFVDTTEKKPIEVEQFEFYLLMEGITGQERYEKRKAFWNDFNKTQERRRCYA